MRPGGPGRPPLTVSVDWEDRLDGPAKRSLISLEGATLRVERPVAAVVRRPQLNPLYHTGPITVLLFVIVFATGLYLTMFYRFGFEASYEAVADLEANLAGRLVRAAHRYGSIAMIVTALLHGWRTFVMDRFRGPRRIAWLTGVAMVALLWVIGVTGYWLLWDERAQVLNEALTRLVAGVPAGLDFLIDNVLTDAAGTGWPFLLLIFAIHLFLSIGVAVLIWVHLKRLARPQWLPASCWGVVVGGSLLIMSLLWPLGTLEPLDRARLVGAIPIDPFFLFLLPGSVTWPPGLLWGGATVLALGVMFVPWFFRRRRPTPIVVDADRCNGCTLCVADCPYQALRMVDREDGPHLQLAVVEYGPCVACGICVGSCPVNALSFGGLDPDAIWAEVREAAGHGNQIVFTCERHAWFAEEESTGTTVVVPCAGMVHPDLLGVAIDGGSPPHIVGCPPGDCANREGNTILAERVGRWRRPRLRRRYADADITMDWIPPDRFPHALETPGAAASAAQSDPVTTTTMRRAWPLLLLVMATAALTVWVTGFRFDPGGGAAATITLALDHRAGVPLVGFPGFEPAPTGAAPRVVVEIDGATAFDRTIDLVDADEAATALAWERIEIDAGTHDLRVSLFDTPGEERVLFDDTIAVAVGETIVLDYRDVPVVVAADAGRDLYFRTALGTTAGCRICHSLEEGETLVGPSLAGVATRAATAVAGLDAAGYLRQSIVDPDAYVVAGFPAGQMLPGLDETLTTDEIDNLVAFMLTLEEER